MAKRLKLFSAQLFLLISSVFTEQSQKCVKNVTPAIIEQGDLLWKDNLTHCSCQVWWRHTYFQTDDLAQEEDLLQRYRERIDNFSQQDRVSKFCTGAGFLTTVEVGQYFMTKDTEKFLQFTDSVVCREYTLPRDESKTEPKGWIRGNTKIGPVLEVTTSNLQGKLWSGNQNRVHEQGPFSLVGQNFSWLEWVVHGLEQQRGSTTTSRKPLRCSSKTMR